MTRRPNVWLVGTALFATLNFAGGVVAAAQGELLHTGIHAGLMLVGAYCARLVWRRVGSVAPALPHELTDRLTLLEQSVDAVAIELERIGEGQRSMTRFLTENAIARSPG